MAAKNKNFNSRRFLLTALISIAFTITVLSQAAESSVDWPVLGPVLWDEVGALTPEQKQALIALLIEHRKATDEKVAIALLKDSGASGIAAKSKDLFDEWKLGEGGRGMGALLILDMAAHKARWEIGLGLLPKLADQFGTEVVKDKLLPAWNDKQIYAGIAQTVLETLRATESPLVDSGRATEILQAGGPATYEKTWSPHTSMLVWILTVFAALGSLAVGLFTLSAAEAHFTSAGWFKPRPHLSAAWDFMKAGLRRRRGNIRFGGTQNDW